MMPNSPTIQPWFRSEKSTPYWPVKGPASRIAQLSPASVLCMILPLCPTIQPLFASVNRTNNGPNDAPLFFWSQVTPPSVVFRITPAPPTAQPVLLLLKKIDTRVAVEPLEHGTQEMPLVVRSICPFAPQTQAWALSWAATPSKRSVTPELWPL